MHDGQQKGLWMTRKEIRTQYSGFIFFTAKLISVATGIAFTLMITRSVTEKDFGAYGTLNISLGFFTILSSVVPFWLMRFVARDKEGAVKTGIVANMIIAGIAVLVYITLFPLIITAFRLEDYVVPYAIVTLQIIELYFIAALEACLQAQRPHFVGYGLLVSEGCKVILAYMLIVQLRLSFLGIVLSLAIAFGVKIAFYFRTIWEELRSKINFKYIKEWLKGSSFNMYNIAGDRIAAIIFLMIPIYGGQISTSYYEAALSIAGIVTYSSFLAYALYPKLLAENTIEEVTVSLKTVLMFAIPMTVGILAIPSSYLIILKGVYVVATPVLAILAVDSLILTTSSIFSTVLFGIEKFDEKAEIPFRQVIRSRLFILFSLPYVHSLITLPTAFYLLNNFANNQPLLVSTYVTAINTLAHFAMFVVLYIIVRKAVKVTIPWRNITKYVFASLVMAPILIAVHPTRLSLTLVVTAVGGIFYLTLLMLIDKETRKLVAAILRQIRKNKLIAHALLFHSSMKSALKAFMKAS